MQNLNKFLWWGALLPTLLFSFHTQADDFFSKYEKRRTVQLFAGSYFATNIRKDNLQKYYDTSPIEVYLPYLRLRYDNFQLTPDKMSYTCFKNLWAEMDLRISYKGHAYKAEGMAIRHKTIYGGLTFRILMLKAEILKDLSGISDATIYSTAVVIPLPISPKLLIMLQGEIEFWDGKYVDYYFGVRDNEVTATRPAYKGSWSRDYNFQIQIHYRFSEHWLMQITPGFRYYDDKIYDSPTVTNRREYSFLTGLGVEF